MCDLPYSILVSYFTAAVDICLRNNITNRGCVAALYQKGINAVLFLVKSIVGRKSG
jgi:hypothetical protein